MDIEDVEARSPIFSPKILHVIAEFFSSDLHTTVYRQGVLVMMAKELLEKRTNRLVAQSSQVFVWLVPVLTLLLP